jgi:hypothetical protein
MSLDGSSPDRGKPPNFYLLKVVHKKLAFPTSNARWSTRGELSGKIHFESIFPSAKPSTNGRYLRN